MADRRRRQDGGFIGVCGDVHGRLQLALCAWALEQQRCAEPLEAVLLCGDVATFTATCTPDRATRRHARDDPGQLEFRQWSSDPPAPWLDGIFADCLEGGLGLKAPVIMVHGNHEGFDHLERLVADLEGIPDSPVEAQDLPAVDTRGRIRYLPSGWRVVVPGGTVIGGVGGIQPGQRPNAGYPDMAYIDPAAVAALRRVRELDVLITHQGPAMVQGPRKGADILDPLLERHATLIWLHGHGREHRETVHHGAAMVVPLADATFKPRDDWRVPADGWCAIRRAGPRLTAVRRAPRALPQLARKGWIATVDGSRIPPQLAPWITGSGNCGSTTA